MHGNINLFPELNRKTIACLWNSASNWPLKKELPYILVYSLGFYTFEIGKSQKIETEWKSCLYIILKHKFIFIAAKNYMSKRLFTHFSYVFDEICL